MDELRWVDIPVGQSSLSSPIIRIVIDTLHSTSLRQHIHHQVRISLAEIGESSKLFTALPSQLFLHLTASRPHLSSVQLKASPHGFSFHGRTKQKEACFASSCCLASCCLAIQQKQTEKKPPGLGFTCALPSEVTLCSQRIALEVTGQEVLRHSRPQADAL